MSRSTLFVLSLAVRLVTCAPAPVRAQAGADPSTPEDLAESDKVQTSDPIAFWRARACPDRWESCLTLLNPKDIVGKLLTKLGVKPVSPAGDVPAGGMYLQAGSGDAASIQGDYLAGLPFFAGSAPASMPDKPVPLPYVTSTMFPIPGDAKQAEAAALETMPHNQPLEVALDRIRAVFTGTVQTNAYIDKWSPWTDFAIKMFCFLKRAGSGTEAAYGFIITAPLSTLDLTPGQLPGDILNGTVEALTGVATDRLIFVPSQIFGSPATGTKDLTTAKELNRLLATGRDGKAGKVFVCGTAFGDAAIDDNQCNGQTGAWGQRSYLPAIVPADAIIRVNCSPHSFAVGAVAGAALILNQVSKARRGKLLTRDELIAALKAGQPYLNLYRSIVAVAKLP